MIFKFSDLYHIKRYFYFIFIILFPCIIYTGNFGTTTAEFTRIKPEAKPSGMGDAYIGIADDSSSLIYNPSGLALLDKSELAGTSIFWFNSIMMYNISFAHPFERGTGFGINILWVDIGNFNSTGIPGYEVTMQDAIINAGFGKTIFQGFNTGINIKVLYERFADISTGFAETSIGVSADAGILFELFSRNFSLGLVGRNFGFMVGTEDPLPMEIGLGFGFKLISGKDDYFNFDIDISKILNTDNFFIGTGFEWTIFKIFSIRFGFRYNNSFDIETFSFSNFQNLLLLSGGIGINISDIGIIDYSYNPMGVLGDIHRIGIKITFGESLYEQALAEQKALIVPKALEIPKIEVSEGQIKAVSFKPNIPQEKVKEWTLNIKTYDGKIIKTYSGIGEVPKDLKWDGTDSVGKIVKTDVSYIFDFKAKDMEGQIIKSMGNIIQPQKISPVEFKEEFYKPIRGREIFVVPINLLVSGDSEERKQVPFIMVNDKIKEIVSWDFDILSKSGTPKKKFSGNGNIPLYIVWDGKDFDGNYVEDLKDCKYVLTLNGKVGSKATIKDRRVIRDPFVISTKTKRLKAFKFIYFEPNSYELTQEMEQRMKEIVDEIITYKNIQIYIQGHSSVEGDKNYNIWLSQQRAKTVLRYIVEKYKISPLSITTVGYGADIPYDIKDTEETRSRSRRVEIIIMGEIEK
ncbi:MAG: PorV/PorQ family protein [Candidatus Goldbacteria bacterium]|nr:PorV/PorQ family protein [Candidatus Goldiibacteriota bacterium]